MADVRINALATTASSSASDDYVAIDGSANGTRKLSAYSPSFGGNATVGGTLTVSSSSQSGFTGGVNIGGSGGTALFLSAADTNPYGAKITNTSTGQVRIELARTGGTASDWIQYLPSGSTDLRFYYNGGVDVLTLASSGNATLAGNLTVSGTGASTIAGNVGLGITPVTSSRRLLQLSDSGAAYVGNMEGVMVLTQGTYYNAGSNYYGLSGTAVGQLAISGGGFYFAQAPSGTSGNTLSFTYGMVLNPAGNLLLKGDTTDSGNGKLQLATHTTSAGGIGFGTDVSLYHAASAGQLTLDYLGGSSPVLNFAENGTVKAILQTSSGSAYLTTQSAGASVVIRSGANTTALTLDSSQRTIATGVFWNSSTGNVTTNGFNTATSIANNVITLYEGTGSANIERAGRLTTYDGGSGWYGLNLQVPSAAYPNFSGTVTWQDAITADARLVKLAAPISTQGGTASTPASASDGGTAGTIQWDASYIYVCTAANTWKRVAIATW